MGKGPGGDPGAPAAQLKERGVWSRGEKAPKRMVFQGEILGPRNQEPPPPPSPRTSGLRQMSCL